MGVKIVMAILETLLMEMVERICQRKVESNE